MEPQFTAAPGHNEGDKCNRDGCQGIIEIKFPEGRSCTCYRNPPCARCMDVYLACPVCGWDSNEDEILLHQSEDAIHELPEESQAYKNGWPGAEGLKGYWDGDFPRGMIPFFMQGDLGKFEDMYERAVSMLNPEDPAIRQNLISAIWQFGNQQWQKGREFGQEDCKNILSIPRRDEVERWYQKEVALDETASLPEDSIIPVFIEWLEERAKDKLSPSEAILAFTLFATTRDMEIGAKHSTPAAIELAEAFIKSQSLEQPSGNWTDKIIPFADGPKPFRCPEGLTAVSSECGELDIYSGIDRIEIGPEGAEAIDRLGNRAKVTVCGVDIGSTKWNPKPSHWQRFKAWLIKALAPLGGWGERMSDQ